jgi:hypothetical protein
MMEEADGFMESQSNAGYLLEWTVNAGTKCRGQSPLGLSIRLHFFRLLPMSWMAVMRVALFGRDFPSLTYFTRLTWYAGSRESDRRGYCDVKYSSAVVEVL